MKQLTPTEFQFVTEILNGATTEQAGEAVGIKRRAAFQWKAKEHIQAAIAAGKQGEVKIVQEFQAERMRIAMPEISKMLEEEAPKAIKVIIEIMYSGGKDDVVRLQAAKEVIKLSGLIEMQRVTQNIEQAIKDKGLSPEEAEEIRAKILGVPQVNSTINTPATVVE